MNRALVGAWLAAEAIVIWRLVHRDHRMPVPGELLGVTGLFAGLALVADVFPRAAPVIVMGAFGLDVAGFLNLLPKGLGGQIGAAANEPVQAQQAGGVTSG